MWFFMRMRLLLDFENVVEGVSDLRFVSSSSDSATNGERYK
jgi:hypothetical protein